MEIHCEIGNDKKCLQERTGKSVNIENASVKGNCTRSGFEGTRDGISVILLKIRVLPPCRSRWRHNNDVIRIIRLGVFSGRVGLAYTSIKIYIHKKRWILWKKTCRCAITQGHLPDGEGRDPEVREFGLLVLGSSSSSSDISSSIHSSLISPLLPLAGGGKERWQYTVGHIEGPC